MYKTLKELRKKRKLLPKQMAKRLNVSYAMYSNWESGRSAIPTEYIRPICQTLNVSADRFLNYQLESVKQYADRFEPVEGLIDYLNRDEKNKYFIIWLFNEFDGDVDGVVLMSIAYACMQPETRKHISKIMWDLFENEFQKNKSKMPHIAESVHRRAPEYAQMWRELDERGRFNEKV